MLTYESRTAAYNEASELLKARPKTLPGWFICKRRDGSFVLWPMSFGRQSASFMPTSYKIVDEVYC